MGDTGTAQFIFGQVDLFLKNVRVVLKVILPIKIVDRNVPCNVMASLLFMDHGFVRKNGQRYALLQQEHGEKAFVVKGIVVVIPYLEIQTVREIPLYEIL
jgi:hypothetical protein